MLAAALTYSRQRAGAAAPFAAPSCGTPLCPSQSRPCPALCRPTRCRTWQTHSGRGRPGPEEQTKSKGVGVVCGGGWGWGCEGVGGGGGRGVKWGTCFPDKVSTVSNQAAQNAGPAYALLPAAEFAPAGRPRCRAAGCSTHLASLLVHCSHQIVCDAVHLRGRSATAPICWLTTCPLRRLRLCCHNWHAAGRAACMCC